MIAAFIQHHPSRDALIEPLKTALRPLETVVVPHTSSPPNPWLGYQLCLQRGLDATTESDHLLVVQDDAVPCVNFAPALMQIAESQPGALIALFLAAVPANAASRARRAMKRGQCYIAIGPSPFTPLVGVLWPVPKAREFLEWAETASRLTRSDDGNVGRWAKRSRQNVLATVPSLIEHPDLVPSVKGGRPSSWGKDRGRVAVFFCEDGLAYNW